MSSPMIDVKSAKTLDELKRQTFVNFFEISKRLEQICSEAAAGAQASGSAADGAPGSSPGTMFDILYIGDANTWITKTNDGDMIFHDVNAGSITLSQIVEIFNMMWEYGSAKGIWFTNAAGTSKRVGLMEDADGITYFNDESEVE